MSRLRLTMVMAGTDLRRRLRNRSFLIMAFVGPLVLATIISLAFGGGGDIEATIGLVDADGSAPTTAFVEGLTSGGTGGLTFEPVGTEADARRQVGDGDIGAAIVLPEGLGASLGGPLDGGEPVGPRVLTTGEEPLAAEVARAVADGFTDRVDAGRLAAATTAALGGEVSPGTLAGIELPVTVGRQGAGDPVSLAAYFGPAMGLLFLFLGVGTVARGLLEEKKARVLDRIRAAPVTTGSLLVARCLSMVITGVASLATIWLVTTVAMGADWGDPLGVVALMVAAALAVAGIAGLVAGLARGEQGADSAATAVAIVFGLLGGSFMPLGELPEVIQALAYATPNGWAQHGFGELSAGGGTLVDVLPHVAGLLGWALVSGLLAARLLPRRLEAA